ncbi:MAG: hypothetical protein PUF41_11330 [Prevotella copri]|nr:hypothetical protein [Segatella copri]
MSVINRHLFRAKDCLSHAKWCEAVLFCPECQMPLALRYKFGEEVRVYVYPRYHKFKTTIENREDTCKIASERDLLGEISFYEWGDFLHDFQSGEDAVFPLQEDREWISEDCERCDPCEFQFDDRLSGGGNEEETESEDTEVKTYEE